MTGQVQISPQPTQARYRKPDRPAPRPQSGDRRHRFALFFNRLTNLTNGLTFRYLAKYGGGMRDFMRVTKALADANRVRILLVLADHELCVCQISDLLGLAPSTMSKHLSILYQAGLIESRKSERWVYYRQPDTTVSPLIREAIDWAVKSLHKTPEAVADRQKLQQILKLDPRKICQRLNRN